MARKNLRENLCKSYARFQIAMIESAQAVIMPALEENRDALSEVLKNTILGGRGPKSLAREPTAEEQFFAVVFQGFIEIDKSLETLADIAVYIRRFPFRDAKSSRDRYLQFMIEAHFAEIYVLRERLKAYLKKVMRQYKYDLGFPAICDMCKILEDCINKSLMGAIDVRHRHVHDVRLSYAGIDRLASLALLSRSPSDDFANLMKRYYREVHGEVRRDWKAKMEGNNEQIRKLLDFFFDALYPILFDSKTNILNRPRIIGRG
jgi:hypothetical protein